MSVRTLQPFSHHDPSCKRVLPPAWPQHSHPRADGSRCESCTTRHALVATNMAAGHARIKTTDRAINYWHTHAQSQL